MFKYSREGVSVLTVLDARRAKKDGLFPVKIQVVFRRKQKYYSTGKNLSREEWERLLKAKSKALTEIREDIESSFSNVKHQINELIQKGDFSIETLNLRLGRQVKDMDLHSAFTLKMRELEDNEQAGTYLNYQSALKSLESFGGTNIPLNRISVDWLKRCERFWLSQGKSYSSISIYLRTLKCILNRAVRDGFLKESSFPFGKNKYEIPQGCGRKLALTLMEIKKVMSYQDGTRDTEEFRDLWVFSYLCNGINFMDLLFLRYSNIIDGEICFVRSKTSRTSKHNREIHAIVTPQMWEIIHKWGNPKVSPQTYIFKYASEKESAFERIKLVRRIVTKCNRRLKKIAENTGIIQLTTYTARHSFATVLKRGGAKTSYISESLGHSNLAVTENYLACFEKEERIKNAQLLTDFKV